MVLSFEKDFNDFEVAHYERSFNLTDWSSTGQNGLRGQALKDMTSFPFVYKTTNSGLITVKFTSQIKYEALEHPLAVELPEKRR